PFPTTSPPGPLTAPNAAGGLPVGVKPRPEFFLPCGRVGGEPCRRVDRATDEVDAAVAHADRHAAAVGGLGASRVAPPPPVLKTGPLSGDVPGHLLALRQRPVTAGSVLLGEQDRAGRTIRNVSREPGA